MTSSSKDHTWNQKRNK